MHGIDKTISAMGTAFASEPSVKNDWDDPDQISRSRFFLEGKLHLNLLNSIKLMQNTATEQGRSLFR